MSQNSDVICGPPCLHSPHRRPQLSAVHTAMVECTQGIVSTSLGILWPPSRKVRIFVAALYWTQVVLLATSASWRWRFTAAYNYTKFCSAVIERPRDASCLSVLSFNSTVRRAQSSIVSYTSASDLPLRTIKFCSVLFVVVVHASCDKQDSVMRGGLCGKLHSEPSQLFARPAVTDPIARYWPRIAVFAYPTCIRR